MTDILVIDDERQVRSALTEILEGDGYCVRSASNGDEGLTLFRENRPDAVILDIVMPVKDGFESLVSFKSIDPTVPVIFYTAQDRGTNEESAIDLGADGYIDKTLEPAQLLKSLKYAIRRALSLRDTPESDIMQVGSMILNRTLRIVTLPGARNIPMSEGEMNILWVLAQHSPSFMGSKALSAAIHDFGPVIGPATIRAQIYSIKTKLGKYSAAVRAVRCFGYAFRP